MQCETNLLQPSRADLYCGHPGRQNNNSVLEELTPLVYDELRRLAARHLRRERPDNTLQSTVLVHEAYLRLIDQRSVQWQNRAHFFGIASQLIRRILVDHARRHHAAKRGAGEIALSLDEARVMPNQRGVDLLVLDSALEGLAKIDPQQSSHHRAPLLQGTHGGRNRRGARHLERHGEAGLDRGEGVAPKADQ